MDNDMATKRARKPAKAVDKKEKDITVLELPPLPDEVWTPLGMVPVILVAGLAGEDGKALCGQFDWGPRVIRIADNLSPITAWQTLAHEWLHVVFYDAGLHIGNKTEERVCDAYGSVVMAWILAGGKFPFILEDSK
jgi:hypothetical protein